MKYESKEQELARSKNRRKIENSRKREKGVAITASEKRERFDKCTQVCYIARMARNVKSQI